MAFLQVLGIAATLAFILDRGLQHYSFGWISTTILLTTVQVLALQTYRIVLYPRFFSPLRHLPGPKDGDFFLGQTRRIFRDPSGIPMREWVENIPNEGLIKYQNFFDHRVVPTNPKTLGEVLVTKNYDFAKPAHFLTGLVRILGLGVFLAEGDEHKRQRKLLMPAFAYRHIKDLYPVFWSKSRELVDCLLTALKSGTPIDEMVDSVDQDPEKVIAEHGKGSIEVGDWVSRATLDIIGISGVGQDFHALQDPTNELNQTYRMIFNPGRAALIFGILGLFVPHWVFHLLPLKRNHDLESASAYIKQLCRDLIAQKRKAMLEKERREVDIVSVALESGGFSDEDLVNQMMTFLVAGHETTATAMQWAIYLLCRHPEIQTKLRDEVRAKLPALTENVIAAQVDGCEYLHAVCSEVLRVWSPVALTMRIAACDTSINGQFIPKGTTVILSPWAINMSTHLWGRDALEFKPERWLDADGKANNKGGADSNFSFLTFLHGPRGCIGQRFAQAEFACLLAAWVGKFETSFEDASKLTESMPEIKGGITSKPKGGLWVKLKEVDGW